RWTFHATGSWLLSCCKAWPPSMVIQSSSPDSKVLLRGCTSLVRRQRAHLVRCFTSLQALTSRHANGPRKSARVVERVDDDRTGDKGMGRYSRGRSLGETRG